MLRTKGAALAAASALFVTLAGCGGGGGTSSPAAIPAAAPAAIPGSQAAGGAMQLSGQLQTTTNDPSSSAPPGVSQIPVSASVSVVPGSGSSYAVSFARNTQTNGQTSTVTVSATENIGSTGLVRTAINVSQTGLTASIGLQQQLGASTESAGSGWQVSPAFTAQETTAAFNSNNVRSNDGSYQQSLAPATGSSAVLSVKGDLSAGASAGSGSLTVGAPSSGTCGVDATPATATISISAGTRSTALTCWYPNPGQAFISVAGEPALPADNRTAPPLVTDNVSVTSVANPCNHGPATVRSAVERATTLDPLLGTYEERVIALYSDPAATLLCYRSVDYFYRAYQYGAGPLPVFHPLITTTDETLEVTSTSGLLSGNLPLVLDWPPAALPMNNLADPIRAALLTTLGA